MQKVIINNEPAVIRVSAPISQPKADKAEDISIIDSGGFYTSNNVEGALQEAGATDAQQDIDIAVNSADIATNASNIAGNTSDILVNASNIATNTSNIATNTSNIATNTSNIAVNSASIADNTSDISVNTSNIATNTSNIAVNSAGIAGNTSDISSLQSRGLQEVTEQGSVTDQDVEISAQLNNTEYLSDFQTVTGVTPIDLTSGQCIKITLTQDVLFDLLTESIGARTIIIEVVQDSTGGHALTFSGDFGQVEQSNVNTAPNSITNYVMILGSDGKYRGNGYTFSS